MRSIPIFRRDFAGAAPLRAVVADWAKMLVPFGMCCLRSMRQQKTSLPSSRPRLVRGGYGRFGGRSGAARFVGSPAAAMWGLAGNGSRGRRRSRGAAAGRAAGMRARQGSQRKSERPKGAEIAAESPARRGRPALTQTETTQVPGKSKEDAARRNPCRAGPRTSQPSQPRKRDRWVLDHRSAETTLKYTHPANAMVGRERMRLPSMRSPGTSLPSSRPRLARGGPGRFSGRSDVAWFVGLPAAAMNWGFAGNGSRGRRRSRRAAARREGGMRARQGSQRKSERPKGTEIAAESPARRGRPTLTQTETTPVPTTSKEDAAGRNPCRAAHKSALPTAKRGSVGGRRRTRGALSWMVVLSAPVRWLESQANRCRRAWRW